MKKTNIAWRELYAIVLCVAVFGERMSNNSVKMFTDNMAIMHCVNTGTSKDVAIMGLLRSLYYYTTKYNIQYRAHYVPTYDNGPSDSLSRNDMKRFRLLCPNADSDITQPIDVLTDF